MRRVVVAFLAVLVLSAGALGLARWLTPAAEQAAGEGEALIGGPFILTDQNGREVKDEEFRGRLMLVYFGYTFCPDMCPLGLTTIADAIDALPPEAQDQVVPVFITVDPARDTVEVMHDYVGQFSPRLVGLTGSEAAIAAALRAYRVYARKSDAETADGRYLVDHSTFTYLMGRDGKYVGHFGHATTPEEMAKRIETAIAAS
jgi:cytochrome oxidase Cu insertion factor (SCO1/SenC/PrrC family)